MSWHEMLRRKARPNRAERPRNRDTRPYLEDLESRVVLYSASGNAWPCPQLITISFVPDGTNLNGKSSNLFATFDSKFGSASTWENVILRAAKLWARQTKINFSVVSDNGAPDGSGNYQQGDPGFGDIRIGGYDFGNNTSLAQAIMPPPINNYSAAGDIMINTDPGVSFKINGTYNLETVMAHEFGHSLGLLHSPVSSAVMYSVYNGMKQNLTSDDIAGIQSIYGGPRVADVYDLAASNDTFATATDITSTINPNTYLALINNLDLSTSSDVDWYKFTTPPGSNGQLKVTITSQGLSLLDPEVQIYDANDNLLATANGGAYGATVKVMSTGSGAGHTMYVKVFSSDALAQFRTGTYAMAIDLTSGTTQTVPLPNTPTPNGSPLSSGGGIASRDGSEILVNTNTTGLQQTDPNSPHSVGIDLKGDSVVTWESQGEEGSGWGVYAQRFDPNGNKVGSEFLVNTTTTGDQMNPTVAMNASGIFVITWQSQAQDGSGWGIYAQRYNSKGAAQGGEILVNTTTAGDQEYSTVAMDIMSGFVVTWSSNGEDGSGWGVYARQFSPNGTPVDIEVPVTTTTAGDQLYSSVAMSATGQLIIDWSGNGVGDSSGVFMQRFNLSTIADSAAIDTFGGIPHLREHHHVSHSASGHDKGGSSEAHSHKANHPHSGSVTIHRAIDPSAHKPIKAATARVPNKTFGEEVQVPLSWSGVQTRFQFQSRRGTRFHH